VSTCYFNIRVVGNNVCDSLPIIFGRSLTHIHTHTHIYIYITELVPGQNTEELHALLNPSLTESNGLLCSLKILAGSYHIRPKPILDYFCHSVQLQFRQQNLMTRAIKGRSFLTENANNVGFDIPCFMNRIREPSKFIPFRGCSVTEQSSGWISIASC